MSDIYCAEQIKIPPTFPNILKLYMKAAIRTQPYDLLRWTSAYFRALANDEVPPVKKRLEYPPFSHPTGITPGYLKTLLNVFGRVETICLASLLSRWQGIALSESILFQILSVGNLLPARECHFYKFLAIACGFLGKAEDTGHKDICGLSVSQDSRSSETLLVLKEFGIDARKSEIDELHQGRLQQQLPPEGGEIETRPIDQEHREKNELEKSHPDSHRIDQPDYHPSADQQDDHDFPFYDMDDIYDRDKDSSISYGEEGSAEETVSSDRLYDDYEPIGLKDILQGICECLQPVPEIVRAPTPPPPDPVEEFLKRMKTEVEEGRLQTVIKVPGIGPRVSVNRITAVGVWLADCGRRQEGMVGPRNITHFLCPELEDTPNDDISDYD
ncbi:uncharacterized protein LOC100877325 isoform X2 [Megachile rotundata]|uniref:uncharacterized protein LOC100877325 isoform X2 n=1 Tax=Megachile rotundata TaxID=143995 RepID=UPI003FD067F6